MTLAIPAHADTPIFDDLDAHFATIPVDHPEVIDAEIVSVVDVHDSADLDAHFATIPVDRTPAKAGTQPAADNPTISHRPTALEAWLWALAFSAVIGTTWWLKSAAESGAL